MFETETVGPCLVQKLKCRGGGCMVSLPPFICYAPDHDHVHTLQVAQVQNWLLTTSSKYYFFIRWLTDIFFAEKIMALMMAYVEFCARVNVPVYCNKAASIDMQNYAVAGVKQYISC